MSMSSSLVRVEWPTVQMSSARAVTVPESSKVASEAVRAGRGRVLPGQPTPQQRSDRRRQTRAVVGVRRLSDRFSLGRIRVDDAGKGTQTDPRAHRQGDLVDHLARMTGDDGRAENPVRPLLDVDLDEALFLAVG